MLSVISPKSRAITRIIQGRDGLYLDSEAGRYRLMPKGAGIVRVTYTKKDTFEKERKPGIADDAATVENRIIADNAAVENGIIEGNASMENSIVAGNTNARGKGIATGCFTVEETPDSICFRMPGLCVCISRTTASFTYCGRDGNVLLREREEDSKELEEFPVYRMAEGGEVKTETVATADGEKTVIRAADKVQDGFLYHTRLWLDWQQGEALYGLGQHEEGFFNLRGQMVFLHQGNRKIAVPMLVSSRGYGILMDTYSPMIFSDTKYGSYLYTEADKEMDFYFIYGGTMDGVIRGYRQLTGKAALLPKWAFGYLQSQERYETEQQILEVAEEYRRRKLGLDAVVLDWCSWEDGKWGQKSFDAARFPDPAAMIEKLHQMDVHFMMSIWPNMSGQCENYQEFSEKKLLLPGSDIYNAFSEKGRQLYWKQVEEALYDKGVDAWWCDSSEPFTPEWNRFGRTEPAALYAEYCRTAADVMPAWLTNAFGLFHAKCIYDGERNARFSGHSSLPERRVMNLTRSGYTGQQRYGTVLWSGDVAASWDTLRRQIAAGLNFCASGLPYWTTDIGAFFVKKGAPWYWDGKYETANEDLGYRELFVRWYQWGCFLPVFRGHGTDCRRELWQFGEEGSMFYDALAACSRLRYELMPYIYSQAGKVWLEDESMIKLLAFSFPEDACVYDICDQYMFGDSIMVCPVTEPMYYEAGSRQLDREDRTRRVYLPAGTGWYDYWTNCYYEGGSWIAADAPLQKIPLFVREGSILAVAEPGNSAADTGAQITLRVYSGKDGRYVFYEDAGNGYGYENGEYALTEFSWEEETKTLRTELLKQCDTGVAGAVVADVKVIV